MKEKINGLMEKAIKVFCLCVSIALLAGCGEEDSPVLPESIQMREPRKSLQEEQSQEEQSQEEQSQEEQSQAQDALGSSVKPTESASETKPVQNTMEPASEANPQDSSSVQPTEDPLPEEPSKDFEQTATPKPQQTVQDTEENRLTREAYKAALTKILNELKLPDGEALYYDGFYEFSQNKFAIADVDGDGKEELIFDYNTGPMAAMALYVFGYDVQTGEYHRELVKFPGGVFYDNGIIIERASHNHGRGDKLWPYSVYYYSTITDDYRFGVNVDSWEKEYYGENARGQLFPTETDEDGDGIVYYRMDENYEYENPIDGEAYDAWYEELLEGAERIKLDYRAMNQKNISDINQEVNREETSLPQKGDGADWYVDRQGTTEVYSELQIKYAEEGIYTASIGLHRLTTLEGTAKLEGDILFFEDELFGVKGEIRIQGTSAVFTVTDSKFEYIMTGDVFEFPEKL